MKIKKVDLKDKVFTLAYDDCGYDFYDEHFDPVTFISNHRDYSSKGELSHLELDNVIDAYENGGTINDMEIVPINSYIHGNIALSLDQFDCPWDSGVFGFLLFKKGEFGKDNRGLKGFIRSWEALLNGEIYHFILEKKIGCDHCGNVELDVIESVGGFYGYESYDELLKSIVEDIELTDDEKEKILAA